MNFDPNLLNKNPDLAKFSKSIFEVLEDNTLLTLATVNKDGTPHVNTAYFTFDQNINLYIWTEPSTKHSHNVEKNPSVAVTIFDSREPWGKPHKGLQVFGVCKQLDAKEQEYAFVLYLKRFPKLQELAETSDDITNKFVSRFYKIRVDIIKLIDERRYGVETHFVIKIKRDKN